MTTLADGSVVFDRSRPPPAEVDNYVQDAIDHHRWHPAFELCRHRQRLIGQRPCGAVAVAWFCSLKSQGVDVPICESCDKREV